MYIILLAQPIIRHIVYLLSVGSRRFVVKEIEYEISVNLFLPSDKVHVYGLQFLIMSKHSNLMEYVLMSRFVGEFTENN